MKNFKVVTRKTIPKGKKYNVGYFNIDPYFGNLYKSEMLRLRIKNEKIPFTKIQIHIPIWDEEAIFTHCYSKPPTVAKVIKQFIHDFKMIIKVHVYPEHPDIFREDADISDAVYSIGEFTITGMRVTKNGHVYFKLDH